MVGKDIHSTGRGGAGNIGPDDSTYIDGSIVREGVAGESDKPEWSSGRGGAGNIASPKIAAPNGDGKAHGSSTPVPQQKGQGSAEIIPEPALRGHHENFHTGRGGEGNVYKEKYGGHSKAQDQHGFAEKLKDKVEGLLHKEHKDHA